MTCYSGFGNLADGRPFWIGDFNGDGRADVLFYYPGDDNWWLGTHPGPGGQIGWSLAGNTAGFGHGIYDGRPFWIGDFNGDGRADVLFHYPGDGSWWLGSYNANQLVWIYIGNTAGRNAGDPDFGQIWDGRPFWIGNFSRADRAEVLFYYPDDDNWWLGSYNGIQLNWSLVGNTAGFGHAINDGRPFWIGDFNGNGRADVLFYYPGDDNWWLGSHQGLGGQIAWSLGGNTAGFGHGIYDGRPFWIGNFSRADRAEVLFYYPGDGNWWLGSYNGNQLNWSLAGNTGRPHASRVRLHFKVLANPTIAINTMVASMQQVYTSAGILVEVASTENLNLPDLRDCDVGQCVRGATTNEQDQLFQNRNFVGANDIVIYFVRSTVPPFNGCAAHPAGRPGAIVARGASQLTLAHEVGHVLDLNHLAGENCSAPGYVPTRLMTGCGTGLIAGTPTLSQAEMNTMDNSALSINC